MDHHETSLPVHIVAAGGIIQNEANEVLLVKNPRRGWEFPGGQAEVGENIIDALTREVWEETGLEIDVGELFCVSTNSSTHPGHNGIAQVPTKLMLDFICHAKGGTIRTSDEHSAAAFYPKEEVPNLIQAPSYRERYQAFLEYHGRPCYLEYVTWPSYHLKLKRFI